MPSDLASSITKAASRQTYYTIRFLVDRERVDDAYRSYAYFRWVDDTLDSDLRDDGADPATSAGTGGRLAASERKNFLARQKSLLERGCRGDPPRDVCPQENMLLELVGRDRDRSSRLQAYLRNMMAVMEFDAGRRGRLISQAELDEYTRALSVAVTENMHYFIGHDDFTPRDGTRYLAVHAAHVTHMLRDTFDDLRAGYFNIPREVLDAHRIGPQDVRSDAYRAWVKGRVQLARGYFQEGKTYFRRLQNLRHRLAGFAYIARFEWLLDAMEKEGYVLRPQYRERKSWGIAARMGWLTLSSLIGGRGTEPVARPAASRREEQA